MKNNDVPVPTRFNAAIERLDGDVDLLRQMAALTASDLPHVVQSCDEAIADGDQVRAATRLHKLKGMLSQFDSGNVTLKIQRVLDMVRQGDQVGMRQAYDLLHTDIELLTAEVVILGNQATES